MSEPYLFVAYASEDSGLVEPIVTGLNRMGIDTWMAPKDLQPGQSWEVAIREALEGAIGMLVLISRASMKSTPGASTPADSPPDRWTWVLWWSAPDRTSP